MTDPTAGLVQPALSITLENIVFGAITINILLLMYLISCVAIGIGLYTLYLPSDYTSFDLYLINLAALFCLLIGFGKICSWAASGFIHVQKLQIFSTAIFFILYFADSVFAHRFDGYMAFAVILFTALVSIYSRGFRFWLDLSAK
jgi:hypothetical protein